MSSWKDEYLCGSLFYNKIPIEKRDGYVLFIERSDGGWEYLIFNIEKNLFVKSSGDIFWNNIDAIDNGMNELRKIIKNKA